MVQICFCEIGHYGPVNSLALIRRQVITWTRTDLLSTVGTIFSEIWSKIQTNIQIYWGQMMDEYARGYTGSLVM